MEAHKILTADILDIIFDGHNKEYGAYAIRKGYNGRMQKAMMAAGIICIMLLLAYFYSRQERAGNGLVMPTVADVNIDPYKEQKKPEELPIPKIKQPQIATQAVTAPRIVKDNDVKKEDMPPENDKLDDVKISTVTADGIKDDNITRPPDKDQHGVVETPKMPDENTIWTKVEIESTYPGGMAAWARYLNRSIQYPTEASEGGIEGAVMVQFVVDEEGNCSQVEAIRGPATLQAEAVRVIKKSGQWIPAIQNGKKVKSYKMQSVIFKLAEN